VQTTSAAKIAAQFNEYLEASRDQPVLIEQNGKPVAMLLAVQAKADAEQLAAGRARSLHAILVEAHEPLEKGGAIPRDQFWRDVEQPPRAKRRVAHKDTGKH